MVGMKVVVVDCDKEGNVDFEDLKKKAETHSENLGALMVTYPSTHGVFEEKISFKLNEKLETVKFLRLKRLVFYIDLSLTCQKLV